jgi:methylenetetrahydrofolate dehydrogenase (NADP+)/methenyltetrahydrofolate cyclohydrolase
MADDKIIDGKYISSLIKDEIRKGAEELLKTKGIVPGIALILAGDNPASQIYVSSKDKVCKDLGFHSTVKLLPEDTKEETILDLIAKFNNDKLIHGILVQLPLPKHINEQKIIEAIDYKKDVDGLHPQNAGRLVAGIKSFIPCTPSGIVELIKRSGIETIGKNVVVIGRSNIVGKPIANLFINKSLNSTVTVCNSFTKNIREFTQNADIIIVAIGKADFLKADMIKEGVVIIDVGINRIEDKSTKKGYRITGDADYNDCYEKCSKITPVPGGVGPMTIAMLMKNTLDSARAKIYS